MCAIGWGRCGMGGSGVLLSVVVDGITGRGAGCGFGFSVDRLGVIRCLSGMVRGAAVCLGIGVGSVVIVGETGGCSASSVGCCGVVNWWRVGWFSSVVGT